MLSWQNNVYFAYFNCINCHCAALEPLWRELVVRLSHKCHFGLGLCCIFILILKNIIQDSVFPMLNWICCFISLPPPHTPYCRRRIELEDMAKVVASDWGTESLPRYIADLPRSFWIKLSYPLPPTPYPLPPPTTPYPCPVPPTPYPRTPYPLPRTP